jgi:hypothetical protein
MRARTAAAVIAATGLLSASPAAYAQQGGVVVDPGSPSGKEYGIPLDAARRQADPGSETSPPAPQGKSSAPLFGTGISSHSTTTETAKGTSTRSTRSSGSRHKRRATSAPVPPQVVSAAINPGKPGGGIGTPVVVGAFALCVLLAGGLAGLLVRRRA